VGPQGAKDFSGRTPARYRQGHFHQFDRVAESFMESLSKLYTFRRGEKLVQEAPDHAQFFRGETFETRHKAFHGAVPKPFGPKRDPDDAGQGEPPEVRRGGKRPVKKGFHLDHLRLLA